MGFHCPIFVLWECLPNRLLVPMIFPYSFRLLNKVLVLFGFFSTAHWKCYFPVNLSSLLFDKESHSQLAQRITAVTVMTGFCLHIATVNKYIVNGRII